MGKIDDFAMRVASLPPRRAALVAAGGGLLIALGAVGYVAWPDAPAVGYLVAIVGAAAYFFGCWALAVRPAAWTLLFVMVAVFGVTVGPATIRNFYLGALGEENSCRVIDLRVEEATVDPDETSRDATVFLACPDGSRPAIENGPESGVGTDLAIYQDPHGWAAPAFSDVVESPGVNTIGAIVVGLLVTVPLLAYAVGRRHRPRPRG